MKNLPENIWNSPTIRQRLFSEAQIESSRGRAEKPYYYFNVPQVDNPVQQSIELRNYYPSIFDIDPHDLQKELALKIRQALQHEVSHGGCWIVGWTHPPAQMEAIREDGDNVWGRLVIIWLDEDADPHYTLESDISFIAMATNGVDYYVRLAENAHEKWLKEYSPKVLKEDMGLKDDQQHKDSLSTLH